MNVPRSLAEAAIPVAGGCANDLSELEGTIPVPGGCANDLAWVG